MKSKRILAGIASLAVTASMSAAFPSSALAAASDIRTKDDIVTWMKEKAVSNVYKELEMEVDQEFSLYQGHEIASYTVDHPKNADEAPAPARFDLRDVDGKNYVTPVKLQNPYGTCWAFAATSAAEVSVAYEAGIDLNTASEEDRNSVEFSERHLAYFTGTPLGENFVYPSQAGEGNVRYAAEQLKNSGDYTTAEYNDLFFNTGGFQAFASTLYSAFIGPVQEAYAPYQNDEGTTSGSVYIIEIKKEPSEAFGSLEDLDNYAVPESLEPSKYHSQEELDEMLAGTLGELKMDTLDWYKGNGKYYYRIRAIAPEIDGTWVLDESLRFNAAAELESSCILPCPVMEGDDSSYHFSQTGLNAIKNELVNGRAVSIAYHADQSIPGDAVKTDSFISFIDKDGNPTTETEKADYWCQYTFDPTYDPSDPASINKVVDRNHAVTIVGYDDTIPKEYFRDPNGTIGGDGAFIVKNSWGDLSHRKEGWGSAGSGYFYLSYYDQSLLAPESFDFKVLTDESVKRDKYSAIGTDMYDLVPTCELDEMAFTDRACMANVFSAQKNSQIRAVGYTAVTCNEDISYDIYLLNEDAKSPTDGVLAAHAEDTYKYAGYQRTSLDTPITVKKGQKYSVVVTVKREDGQYGVGLKSGMTKKFVEDLIRQLQNQIDSAEDEETKKQAEKKYNDYKSCAQYASCVVNPGESFLYANGEWTDWSELIQESRKDEYGELLDYDNFGIKTYSDAEVINVVNELKTQKESYQAGDVVDCQVTVGSCVRQDLGDLEFTLNGEPLTTIEKLPMLDTAVLEYQYTITEEDVKNGYFKTVVNAYIPFSGEKYEINLMDDFSTTTLDVSLTNAKTDPVPEETTTPTDTQPSSDVPPKTYTAEKICEMAARDYEVKAGVKPQKTEYTENADGSLTVTLTDDSGNVLDTYSIDKTTASGKNSKGETVDLPQTGANNPAAADAAAAAAVLTVTGAFLLAKSHEKKTGLMHRFSQTAFWKAP